MTKLEVLRAVRRVTDIAGEVDTAHSEQGIGITQVNIAIPSMD